MPFQPIFTHRLILRNLRPEDAEAMFAIRTHPSTLRFQPWHPAGMSEVEAFIETQRERSLGEEEWLQLGILLRDGEMFIGDVGIRRQADPAQYELGITVAPGARQTGYGSEALLAVMDHLFIAQGAHRLLGVADARNEASLALMQRCGMRREAVLRESFRFHGEWTDEVVCAMLREEWERGT